MASILEKRLARQSLILVDTEHSHELEPNQIEETVLHSYDFFFDDIGLIVGYEMECNIAIWNKNDRIYILPRTGSSVVLLIYG